MGDYNVGETIRALRMGSGLTQAGLAARVGVTQQQIANLENEGSNPTVETIGKIAKSLGWTFSLTFRPRKIEEERG